MTKKKLILRIFTPIVLVAVTISAISLFVGQKPSKTNTPNASFVSHNLDIESQIQSDVINQKISSEYNGNYVFKTIIDVSFNKNISNASENLAYEYISGYPDKNTFLYFMNKKKLAESKDEIITLVNGKYTKTKNSKKISEGIYFGNNNKSYVYTEDKNGTIEIDEFLYSIDLEISLTAYWIKNINSPSPNVIYIREKYIYDELASNFMYITYAYEMI